MRLTGWWSSTAATPSSAREISPSSWLPCPSHRIGAPPSRHTRRPQRLRTLRTRPGACHTRGHPWVDVPLSPAGPIQAARNTTRCIASTHRARARCNIRCFVHGEGNDAASRSVHQVLFPSDEMFRARQMFRDPVGQSQLTWHRSSSPEDHPMTADSWTRLRTIHQTASRARRT